MSLFFFSPGVIKRRAEEKEIHSEEMKELQNGICWILFSLCYRKEEILLRKMERNK